MLFIRSYRKRYYAVILAAATATAVALVAPSSVAAQASPRVGEHVRPASISGQVLTQMDPIGEVRVTVFDAFTGRILKSQWAEYGEYNITGLPPVPIKVVSTKRGYWSSWASNENDWAHADVIVLHPGEHLDGRNDYDAWSTLYMDVMQFSSISGTVLGEGEPLAHAVVTMYDAVTDNALRSVVADAQGHFRFGPLRWGRYKVGAAKTGWVTGYANEKPTLAEADAHPLWAGENLNGDRWPHLNLTRNS